MSTIWRPRTDVEYTADLIGYAVHGLDGEIGTVAEATVGTGTDHIVVHTGTWFMGQDILLPVGMIEMVEHRDRIVYVELTGDEVKAGPIYDPDRHQRPDDDFWSPYDDYYGKPGGGQIQDPPIMG